MGTALGWPAGTGTQRQLHQHDVEPATELVTNGGERTAGAEARAAMQRNRGALRRVADDGNHAAEARIGGTTNQRRKQGPAQPATLRLRRNVHRILDREPVRRTQPASVP